jgi:hypothetical protein
MGRVDVAGLAPARGPERGELARVGARLPWRRWLSGAAPQHGGAWPARRLAHTLT